MTRSTAGTSRNDLDVFSLIAITPARNEFNNLQKLLNNLNNVRLPRHFHWHIVVNNSSDNSYQRALRFQSKFPISVIQYESLGNLTSGAAWKAWDFGLKNRDSFGEFDFVMKLDADVRLASDYFLEIAEYMQPASGIIGGVTMDRGNREQLSHVQGAVKMYSSEAISALNNLPRELGFDVLDEICVENTGLATNVILQAKFHLDRDTGASEGFLKGRMRNGKMCRNVGYNYIYFILHLTRYLFKKPYVVGSLCIAWGYFTSRKSPFPKELRVAHKKLQREKLTALMRHPVRWIRQHYFVS